MQKAVLAYTVILAVGMLKQKDDEFKANLGYSVRPSLKKQK